MLWRDSMEKLLCSGEAVQKNNGLQGSGESASKSNWLLCFEEAVHRKTWPLCSGESVSKNNWLLCFEGAVQWKNWPLCSGESAPKKQLTAVLWRGCARKDLTAMLWGVCYRKVTDHCAQGSNWQLVRLQEIPSGSIYKNLSKNRAKLLLVFGHF